jgi:NAD dependent epimerase/dehydratase family enzyme
VSIDDEVGAIRFVIDHGEIAGPVNSTAPTPVTNAEFADALGSALHRPTFVPVPKFGPRLVVGRELADALLFVSQRVLPGVLSDNGYEFAHPDIAGALDALLGPTS